MPTVDDARTRRNQAERSATTREALLDATIALPGRGGLREHDDRARGRARRRLARRAPAPLPDAQRAGRRGRRAPARTPRRASSWPPPTRCRPGPSASRAGARPAVAQLHQPAVPGRARPVVRTGAPTRSCARTSSRSSATLDRQTLELARRLFPAGGRAPGLRAPRRAGGRDDPRARRCSTRCTPAASAAASSGRSAARGWPQCSKKASDHALTCRLRALRASAGVPRRWGLACWRWGWSWRDWPRRRSMRRPRLTDQARCRTSTSPARTASAPREPRLEGVVHGRRRHAVRRLQPDDRQHERPDAAVRRHRRRTASPTCRAAT